MRQNHLKMKHYTKKKKKKIDHLGKIYKKLTDKEKYKLHIINCKSGFIGD